MTKDKQFSDAKDAVMENLEAIQALLDRCVDEGMIDYESSYYNELSDLLEDAHLVKTWDELIEIITLAKTLEVDIDAWLSIHGRSSVGLSWPRKP
jgi:hypothetical protein